jgi:hypothetical protein
MKSSCSVLSKEQTGASPSWSARKLTVGLCILVFLWPAIYLCRDIIPVHGTYTAISNDFEGLYYLYKVYLLASLNQNHLPLWSPSEAAGYPLFSNPFAQVFYPPNLLLIPYYAVTGGYTLWDHQVFTVLGLCIFALGLYFWLLLIIPNHRAVLFGVLIMSVSFKMTEIVRFPNAVHTAAWYPWILYAITKLFLSKTNKQSFLNAILYFFSVVCLCTAGYPYYVYYSVFLLPVYFCIFLWPFLRKQFFGNMDLHIKRGIFSTIAASIFAACICSPYFAAVAGLMSQTVDRGGKNYHYSTAHIFNLQDTIGSLIYPPWSQTEGWYFFSITALLIIILHVTSLIKYSSDEIRQGNRSELSVKTRQSPGGVLFLLGWMAVISYISYGSSSYLFDFLWNYMPGFSSLRVWGRLNIILVPLLAWLLSISYCSFEEIIDSRAASSDSRLSPERKGIFFIFIPAYLLILEAQLLLYRNNFMDDYWVNFLKPSYKYPISFILMGIAAFVIIFIFLKFYRFLANQIKHFKIVMFAVLVLIAIVEMWPVGANTWVKRNQTFPQRSPLNITDNNIRSFSISRLSSRGIISLSPTFYVGTMENWDFARYVDFLNHSNKEKQPLSILLGTAANPQKIFISQSLKYTAVQAFLDDSLRFKQTGRLISYNGDELVWELDMPVNGYLSFIDNWDPFWKAYVDNKETPIERLFDTFKSIRLTQGKHQVIFRYEPALSSILFGIKL